jgi:hypothetical protein
MSVTGGRRGGRLVGFTLPKVTVLSQVADQPWFLPENQGDPSMQIHPTRIDIFVIHKLLQRRDNHLPAG